MDHYFIILCIYFICTEKQSTLYPVFFTITVDETLFCINYSVKEGEKAEKSEKFILTAFSGQLSDGSPF